MDDCELGKPCIFGTMSEREVEEFAENMARRGAKRALEEIGLSEPEAKELVSLFKDFKTAKAATKSWLLGVLKDSVKYIGRIIFIIFLISILVKFGVPADKVEQFTRGLQ